MKAIESNQPKIDQNTSADIKDFWTRNVNAEEIMGKKLSEDMRGSELYYQALEQQRYRSHQHLLPWIHSMQPNHSVLEIGCGIGMDSYQMALHGLHVTGIDLTDVAVQTVSQRFERLKLDGHFETGDATALQFEDQQFDYVYSFGVLHHTQDTEKSIEEVYRVLKKGGQAKIMLYNRHSLNEAIHRITRIPFEDKHELCPVVRRFTRKEVKQMFHQFEHIEIHKDFVYGEGYGFVYKLTPNFLYRMLSRVMGWHLMITATK